MKLKVASILGLGEAKKEDNPLLMAAKSLPFRISMIIRLFMDDVAREFPHYAIEKDKLIIEYGKPSRDEKGNVVPNKYDLPKPNTEKGKKFEGKYLEIVNTDVEVRYKPIDLEALANDEDFKNKVVDDEFISLVDQLNKVYEEQNPPEEKKKEPETEN